MQKTHLLLIFLLLISSSSFSQFGEPKDLVLNNNSAIGTCSFDVDGDGDQDYVAGYYYKILWYENLGDYNFKLGEPIEEVSGFTKLTNADVNSDGYMDLLYSCGNGVYLVKGAANGVFEQAITIAGFNSTGLDVDDIDGDGDLDLVVSENGTPRVKWYENDGGGNFQYVTYLGVYEGTPEEISISDLDGDGENDVAVVYQEKVAWYKNLGAGTFSSQIIIDPVLASGSYIVSGDVDNDGDIDIVASSGGNPSYSAVKYYENDGSGTFSITYVTSSNWPIFNDIELFDYDEDGDLDILTADSYGDKLVVHLFDGLEFGNGSIFETPLNCNIIRVFDADGDNHLDLITSTIADGAGGSGDIILLKNNGNQVFENQGIINNSVANINKTVFTTDVNSDGHIDVFYVQDNKTEYIRNTGASGFDQRIRIENNLKAFLPGVGDVNGDGHVDIVLTDILTDGLYWQANDGAGNFGAPQLILDNIGYEKTMVVDDLNADGYADVYYSTIDEIVVCMNDGSGNFGPSITVYGGLNIDLKDLISFDIDNDGDKEIFSFSGETLEFFYFENIDGISFGPYELIGVSSSDQVDLDFGDLNGDNNIDLISMAWSGAEVYWYPNQGGSFGSINYIGLGPDLGKGIKAMDMDADGDLDIGVVSNYVWTEEFGWFENYGNGTFSNDYIIVAATKSYSLFGADFDEDGDIDPGVVSTNDSYLRIFNNFYYSEIQVKGELFVDVNLNGILDSLDMGMTYATVGITPENDFAFTAPSGKYFVNFLDTLGTYLIEPETPENWSIVTDSLSYIIELNGAFVSIDSLNFGFYPDTLFDAINPDIVGGFPRCNSIVNYWVNVKNTGTTVPSGLIKLVLDDSLEFVSSSIIPDSISAQTIYWSYDSLSYFSDYQINVQVQMPDFMSEGDTLLSTLHSTADSIGQVVYSNSSYLEQILKCAYDPNDKIATPAGVDTLGYISINETKLDYTIRFQNTGSDTAFRVVIKDQLDPNLDWESLQIMSASHSMDATINPNGEISFRFDNIMLPDSNVNEIASHGYIKYNILLNDGLESGTSIYNTANIYFDENPPVVTNTKINTLYNCESILDSLVFESILCMGTTWEAELVNAPSNLDYTWSISSFSVHNEPFVNWITDTSGVFNISVNVTTDFCTNDTSFVINIHQSPEITLLELSDDTICIENSIILLSGSPLNGTYNGNGVLGNEFNPTIAGEGEHLLYYNYEDINQCSAMDSISVLVVDCLGVKEDNLRIATIYPNPFNDFTTIYFDEELTEFHTIIIHDMIGSEVYRNDNVTGSKIEIKKEQLSVGIYSLSILNNNSKLLFNTKVIIE